MRILLADDQAKVRFALRVLLERGSGLEVVGDAVDAADLLTQAETACPDMVLLDWGLPGPAMGDLLASLRGVCPDIAIVALSARLEVRPKALAAGADAFVCKCDPPERLLAVISDCGG